MWSTSKISIIFVAAYLIGCAEIVAKPQQPMAVFPLMHPQVVCSDAGGMDTDLRDLDMEPIYLYSCGYFYRGDGKPILIPLKKLEPNKATK